MERHCSIIGVPVWAGSGRRGCDLGPGALRAAGLAEAITALGHGVADLGDVSPGPHEEIGHPNPAVKSLGEIAAWTRAVAAAAAATSAATMPIFLGGDHSLSAGTLTGMAGNAAARGREFFVLWLDSHPDLHTLETTGSGNLHGVPVAYAMGRPGFAGFFPGAATPVRPENICMMGIRSVDPAERRALQAEPMAIYDMRLIDEAGVAAPLQSFLDRVAGRNGLLHVSFDVDFLDPEIAPGVGTTVPGGATFREAHLIMEMLNDSGLVTSLDLAELNPFLDVRGKTAFLVVDLVASLLGRKVMDRPTRRF
jgi:arginase